MVALIPSDAVAVGIGAVLGALSRYQVGRVATEWIASDPSRLGRYSGWHTAGINIAGSFLLGGISASPTIGATSGPSSAAAATAATTTTTTTAAAQAGSSNARRFLLFGSSSSGLFQGLTPRTKLLMGVGFCGSFTTFSSYSVDVVNWIAEGKPGRAFGYVATNNVGGLLAAALGMVLVNKFFG